MRKLLLRLLKVPPDPEPPAGSHASLRVFRAARNFYRLLLFKWVARQVSLLIGILFSLFLLHAWSREMHENLVMVIGFFEILGVAGYLFQIPLSLALVKMDYELRWYIVTDRSLRIRAGIWEIREMTMTFANIQQITVEQGPLQRMLGISNVLVRTAGGGSGMEGQNHGQTGAGNMMHIGYFHGVDNATEIRDLIQERMRRLKDSGLGDPEEEPESDEESTPATPDLLLAAREFAEQAGALRRALTPSSS